MMDFLALIIVWLNAAANALGSVLLWPIAALPGWQTADVFDPTERAVIAYADAVARSRTADDATFAALRAHLPVALIVDLTVTVGWYHLCAAIIGPLEIEVEAESTPG